MTNSNSPLSPKKEMLHTFETIWKYASPTERAYIKDMWAMVMQSAEVLSWKSSSQSNEYHIELKKELKGTHPDIPLGELILKQDIIIVFSEEKVNEAHYRQIIHFPNQGICIRLGIGWLTKDSSLERILFEENEQQKLICTVEALGQKIARSADETLQFWKKTQWHA